MQNSGQYGVSDAPQYVVGRQAAPPHIFSISHDNISIAPPAAHALHSQQHHLPHHLQAQAQQQQHHYGPHPGHQPHPSLQLIHQTQHPQFPLAQHPSQQQSAQDVHQQVHQQQQQAQQQAREKQQQQREQQQREQQQREQQQREQQQREQQQREQQQREREQQQREQQQQLAQQQAAAQQAMVQQLGLGGPVSPEVPSPGVSRPSPTKYTNQQQLVAAAAAAAAQEDDGLEEEGRSTGGNRWPRQETLALIKIRSEMDANFRDSGLKGPLWEEVSRKLAEQGFHRSAKKCKEKFENVHKYYKKTKDGKAGRQDGKSYRFFSQLEALYGGTQQQAPAGGQLDHADTAAAASLLMPGRAAAAGEDYNGLSAQRQSEVSTEVTLSESMSEDDYDEPESGAGAAEAHQNSKKRKRTTGGSKAEFFETLMKNLVEKQEGMQQKFLEFMERREQERQARDEQWRRQEMARVAREHELRVQEQQLAATRDAALVAFLQKVTGQTLTLPHIPIPPPPPPAPVIPPAIDSVVTPKPQIPSPTPPPQHQLVAVANPNPDADPDRDSPVDPNSKRWPKPEVLTLIKLRSDMEPRFHEAGLKGPLWEEISQGMACLGYNRNQKRCKEKWENINKYFRKTKESNKKRPENAKTCPYFHQLEILYMSGKLGTPHNKQVAKVAGAEDKASPQNAVPLAQRIDAAAAAGNDGETLMKMLPAAADAVQNAAASSGNGSSGANAGHLFSSPDNGSSGATKAHVSEASI